MMPEIDFNVILTWPQAVVAMFLIFAFMIWPGVQAQLARRETQAVKKTLTENNGGGSVKDALDRIEESVTSNGRRLTHLEAELEKNHPVSK